MDQEFNPTRNVYLDRDLSGRVRQLRHVDAPFLSQARTPQLVAGDYLRSFADLLEVPAAGLSRMSEFPAQRPEAAAAVELRYLGEKSQFDTATVAFHQTALGLPVWEAGVAVQMTTEPFRVLSSQSTQHAEVEVQPPAEDELKRAESLTSAQLVRALGLHIREKGEQPNSKLVQIEGRQFVIYRYEADKVQRDGPPSVVARDIPQARIGNGRASKSAGDVTVIHEVDESSMPWLPLPPVPDSIREGDHRVGLKVDFALPLPTWGELHWTTILDVDTLAVLYLRPHVDDVTGLVFDADPITTNGGPLPSGTSATLNPVRVSRAILGLNAPSGGNQSLVGDTVALVDSELPTIAAPTSPGGTNFDFDARSNNFSAVNAYVHCDRFFRLVDSMGFSRAAYFSGTSFPSSVDHRGRMNSTDGIEVNAHCLGTGGGAGILRTTFALANTVDTANPIGIADDFRVVLHELAGHGVLYNHVHSANFGFAHSAGDSVAAILNDPGSQAPDRFVTFPWVSIGRRHDRLPSGGWGWAGNIGTHPFVSGIDGSGYNNEQILSSTLFRLYRSLGGDSADLNTQRFAARMAVYLILRAIGTLTQATNPSTAAGFETALETADSGDWVSENITGGAYRKVLRWAFEKQGMFQAAGTATPNNNPGVPPAVDVYINDGRNGEYQFQPNHWSCTDIWNRRTVGDGGGAHQEPVVGQTNYAYVRIKNRGTSAATGITVKGFHCQPGIGLVYPDDWEPMTTAQLSAPNLAASDAVGEVVGPFEWTPSQVGHECMFFSVSASGDASNIDGRITGSIPEWRLVPHDNNIGQRNVHPVAPSLTKVDLAKKHFWLRNPFERKAEMKLSATLPAFMRELGWRLEFVSAGGSKFGMAAGAMKEISFAMVAGSPLERSTLPRGAEERTIEITAEANGIPLGGMSYVIDPDYVDPNKGETPHPGHEHEPDECAADATELLKCLKLDRAEVEGVSVRRVSLDITFKEDCR